MQSALFFVMNVTHQYRGGITKSSPLSFFQEGLRLRSSNLGNELNRAIGTRGWDCVVFKLFDSSFGTSRFEIWL